MLSMRLIKNLIWVVDQCLGVNGASKAMNILIEKWQRRKEERMFATLKSGIKNVNFFFLGFILT